MPRSDQLNREMRARSRTQLMSAARRLFAAGGYFQTKVSDIAREAGMSQGNVYWYFSSKEELLKAVLADGFESLSELMETSAAEQLSSGEKLDRLLDRFIEFGREGFDFFTIFIALLAHGGPTFLLQLGFDLTQIGIGYHAAMRSIVEQGQAEGTIVSEADPDFLAMLFFGLFNGLMVTYGEAWMQLPESELRTAVRRLLDVRD